jgi:transposase InsO family protein
MLYRWSLKLAGYNYDVEYKKREKHGNADGPSRNPVNLVRVNVQITPLEKLMNLQHQDDWCNHLIRKVYKKGNKILKMRNPEKVKEYEYRTNDHESWIVKEDTLWHRIYKKGETIDRKYIPLEMRRDILEAVHNRAHLGFKKTYAHLQRRFFWRNMSKDCNNYCRSCELCQRRYTPSRRGLRLGKIYATKRNGLIGMDIFSGLPESNGGYRYILVMTDYVTKYVVAVPLVTKTAEKVAEEFIDKWCLIHSWPERIQTDQGGEFTGKVLKAIAEAANVRRTNTTPYHPQSNGQVERINKVIAQMLSKKCYNNQRNWDKYLQEVVYEYNCSQHRVTGHSPFYLMVDIQI